MVGGGNDGGDAAATAVGSGDGDGLMMFAVGQQHGQRQWLKKYILLPTHGVVCMTAFAYASDPAALITKTTFSPSQELG